MKELVAQAADLRACFNISALDNAMHTACVPSHPLCNGSDSCRRYSSQVSWFIAFEIDDSWHLHSCATMLCAIHLSKGMIMKFNVFLDALRNQLLAKFSSYSIGLFSPLLLRTSLLRLSAPSTPRLASHTPPSPPSSTLGSARAVPSPRSTSQQTCLFPAISCHCATSHAQARTPRYLPLWESCVPAQLSGQSTRP